MATRVAPSRVPPHLAVDSPLLLQPSLTADVHTSPTTLTRESTLSCMTVQRHDCASRWQQQESISLSLLLNSIVREREETHVEMKSSEDVTDAVT